MLAPYTIRIQGINSRKDYNTAYARLTAWQPANAEVKSSFVSISCAEFIFDSYAQFAIVERDINYLEDLKVRVTIRYS